MRVPARNRAFVHGHTFLHSWSRADDTGSRPAAWIYVPVQSYSCSLRVFYKTLVVGKDTSIIINNVLFVCYWYLVVGKDTILIPKYNNSHS